MRNNLFRAAATILSRLLHRGMGRTGDPPVPSGDSPLGRERGGWLVPAWKYKICGLTSALVFNVALNHCRADSSVPTSDVDKVVAGYNAFAFNLFSELTKGGVKENIFISPASAAFALAMVYNGATGETKKEMEKVLGLGGIGHQEINLANQSLLGATTNRGVVLEIANSLWAQKNVEFNPGFIARNREFYRAQIESVDLGTPSTVSRINQWANEHTHGKIPEIVQVPFPPATSLVLLNAIYFKGTWADKFQKSATKEFSFSLPNGTLKLHPRMRQQGSYDYFEAVGFQMVELPYEKDPFRMLVFLPGQQSGLDLFLQTLRPKNWENWLGGLNSRRGRIEIPKFKLNFEASLRRAVSALGMRTAFGKNAEFGGIALTFSRVNDVIQKSFVEVNEGGTEAAAVTRINPRTLSALPEISPKPFSMIVDRPFFFVIQDTKTGLILFMGAIVDPVL